MPSENLPRLRRFGITAGLALLTYAAAGVYIDSHAQISAFGAQVQIQRPELQPYGV